MSIKTIILLVIILVLAAGNFYFFGGEWLAKQQQQSFQAGVMQAVDAIVEQAKKGEVVLTNSKKETIKLQKINQ